MVKTDDHSVQNKSLLLDTVSGSDYYMGAESCMQNNSQVNSGYMY